MKSYLSLIPVSAKVYKRQNRMTLMCIVISVFLVTSVFSMAEMAIRQETSRLIEKHGLEETIDFISSESFKSLMPIACILFAFVLVAGILMIAGSLNSNVTQRIQQFGMMRCIGMSRKQVIRYVRLEALNWCRTAVPIGLLSGTAASWILCAIMKYAVGGEWADMPQLKVSVIGIFAGIIVGVLTVLIASGKPARKAAGITPVTAVSGNATDKSAKSVKQISSLRIEKNLGISHATQSKKNLFLMVGSFALSIILFLSFSVFIDLVNCLMPQSASAADMEIIPLNEERIDCNLLVKLKKADDVKQAFGRRAVFDVKIDGAENWAVKCADIISFEEFDIKALEKDKLLIKGSNADAVISGDAAFIITDENIGENSFISVFETPLKIAGKLKYDIFSSDGSTEGKTTLIVFDETFCKMTGISDYNAVYIQLENNVTEKEAENLKQIVGNKYSLNDYRDDNNHGTYIAFLVCVYSFLIIIGAVTILNIVNSISISVSSRIKQYGYMRAVGMSKKQVKVMIASEVLTYVVIGFIAGTVLGLGMGRFLYDFLITSHFAYAVWHLPVKELIIEMMFIAVAVISGICSPMKRINKLSITETIGQM